MVQYTTPLTTWIPAGVAWPQASATAVSPAATFAEVSQKVEPLLLALDDDVLALDEEVDDEDELEAVVDELAPPPVDDVLVDEVAPPPVDDVLVDELELLDALDVLPPPDPEEPVALLHAASAIGAASVRLETAYAPNRLRVVVAGTNRMCPPPLRRAVRVPRPRGPSHGLERTKV